METLRTYLKTGRKKRRNINESDDNEDVKLSDLPWSVNVSTDEVTTDFIQFQNDLASFILDWLRNNKVNYL